ncbi:MAG: sucrase/ferredoxin-like family protein [Candidatus Promineifilaceae bacterium]
MTEPVAALPGTVKFYERHLFVCTGHTDWPGRIELDGGFLQALAEMIALNAADMPLKVKMNACDDPGLSMGYDVLVFPDQVRYVGLGTADLEILVQDHLVGNQISDRLQHQPLTGQHVFVCVHGMRDERCGQCGPPIARRFQMELSKRGLTNKVAVRRTSHVGGHAFAGNVLIYPGGNWYGYVTPEDVPRLIDEHLFQGEIVADLWRGRMALQPELQITAAATPGLLKG